MYGEFCIVLDKHEKLNNMPSFPGYGSLLETQTQSYKLGNVHALLRSYELKAEVNEGHVALLLGDAIYKKKLYQNAHELAADNVNFDDFVEKARGSFLLIKIDAQGEKISLHNDPLSLYPVYWFENESYTVVSNMPIWMESILVAAGVEVKRDGLLAGYDLAIGTGAFGVTGWSEFHLIPFGTSATISKLGLRLDRFRTLDRFFITDDSLDDLIEKSAAEIQENVKAIAESRYSHKVSDITGGMDSRLVLASIFSQGLKNHFIYHTNGEYPVPDANCALSIMERFGLTRVRTLCQYSQPVASQPISTFKKFIYQSQGSRFIYDRAFETNCVQNELIKVGGGLAGGFKSTYSLRLKKSEDEEVALEDAVSSMFLPATGYLSDTLVDRLEKELSSEFSRIHEKYGVTYKTAMDFFYILSRNRYFIGLGEFSNSAIRPKLHALYSESLIKAAMKLTDQERAVGKLHYELMKNLSPDLWKLPFADQAWSEFLLSQDKSCDDVDRTPITSKSAKLHGGVREKTVKISSELQKLSDKKEVLNVDKQWREKQRSLGRNWMWRNFDIIHSQAKKISKERQFEVSGVFKKEFVGELLKNSHRDFTRASDLRSVVNVLFFLLFIAKMERPSQVSIC